MWEGWGDHPPLPPHCSEPGLGVVGWGLKNKKKKKRNKARMFTLTSTRMSSQHNKVIKEIKVIRIIYE